MTLWGGVFSQATDDAVRRLNDSLRFDWRLYDVDITGSQAWARALADAGVLTPDERDQIVAGLERVRAEFGDGSFAAGSGDEVTSATISAPSTAAAALGDQPIRASTCGVISVMKRSTLVRLGLQTRTS